jgi:hypothetical protein
VIAPASRGLLSALFLVGLCLLGSPAASATVVEDGTSAASHAASPPVVVVVFDQLPLLSLLDEREQIDAFRYPHFAAFARDSIWFRNATTVATSTHLAVPAILTGMYPRRGVPPSFEGHPNNLFTLLRDLYPMNVHESQTRLCPPALCPQTPRRFAAQQRRTRAPYSQDRRGKFERFVRSIRAGRPALNFIHAVLPHGPWEYFPSGTQYPPLVGTVGQPLGDAGAWHSDALLVRQAQVRHLLQVGFVDRLLGELIRRLRRLRIYERSLIVVTADHGMSFRPGDKRRNPTPTNLQDVAYVPLLVKLPGPRLTWIEDAHVETTDIVPTIAGVLGLPVPWPVDGRSALSEPGSPLVRLQYYGVADAAALEQRRRVALRREIRLFGSGPRGRFFSVAPHPELLGRRLATLAVAPWGRASAIIDQATTRRLWSVKPRSGTIPAFIGGRIDGDARRGMTVAVAVNGWIAALTRTFSVGGSVRFGALVPERVFRRGSNAVEVLFVDFRGGTRRLRTLAVAPDSRRIAALTRAEGR